MIRQLQKQLHIVVLVFSIIALVILVVMNWGVSGIGGVSRQEGHGFDSSWVVMDSLNGDYIYRLGEDVEVGAGSPMVLKNRLPETIADNSVLLIGTQFQHFDVKVGDQLIYYMDQGMNHTLGQEPFPGYYMIPIPVGYAGQELILSITSAYDSYSGKLEYLTFGTQGDVMVNFYVQQLPGFFGAILLLLLAGIVLAVKIVMGTYGKGLYELTYVMWLLLGVGTYLFMDNKLCLLYFETTQWLYTGRLMLLLLIPLFYMLYLYSIIDKKRILRYINVAMGIFLLQTVVAFVMILFDLVDISRYITVTSWILLAVMCGITFVCVIGGYRYYKKDLTYLAVSNIVLGVGLLAGKLFELSDKLMAYGDLCFVAGVAVWSLMLLLRTENRIVTEYRSIQKKQERELLEYQTVTLRELKPDAIFGGFHALLNLMKLQDDHAPQFLVHISDYVRGRLNMLLYKDEQFVDFDEEMRHVVGCLEIHMQNSAAFSYELELKMTEFKVPAFTIEPFVENAVQYGSGSEQRPTTIMIKSYETKDAYAVQIVDTGKGFDVDKVKSRGKYGITATTGRLLELCNASVDIKSKLDKGTVVTIKYPKIASVRGEEVW